MALKAKQDSCSLVFNIAIESKFSLGCILGPIFQDSAKLNSVIGRRRKEPSQFQIPLPLHIYINTAQVL